MTIEATPDDGTVQFDKLTFRNYIPKNEALQEFCCEKPTCKDIEQDCIEVMEQTLKDIESAEMLNVAPKKPNWDLKRDVQRHMEVLSRRTDRAIVKLIRVRMQSENKTVDYVGREKDDEEEEAGDGYALSKTVADAKLGDDLEDYD